MAAKKVASALHVLTSDGLLGCDDWSDNNAFEALVADYFAGSGYDSTEESDNDDIGIPLPFMLLSTHVKLVIGDVVAECSHVEDDINTNDGQEEIADFGKKYFVYIQ